MPRHRLPTIHPGVILRGEFLEPMGLSAYRLANDISVPPKRISEILRAKRSVSADTALRLGKYFGISAQFWMNLQSRYDLESAEDSLRSRLAREVKVRVA